jgi:hypothetical protein
MISADQARLWSRGDFASWARETSAVAVNTAYGIGSPPGCDSNAAPLDLPKGYDDAAQAAAMLQLERAGVRLALVLERALGPLPSHRLGR